MAENKRKTPLKTVELIRGLSAQGWNKAKISRELGIRLPTVRKYINGGK